MKRKPFSDDRTVILLALIWFVLNLFVLQSYPFVHTDEAWLSGLTRSMMEEKSFSATEDFFDLYPRHPHAVKIIYHLLQIPFIALFGYGIYSVRLLSLLAGACAIPLFFRLLKNINPDGNGKSLLLITALMAVDVQFLYGTHMARQESLLLLMEISILLILTERDLSPSRRGLIAGLITGLAAGIHPNAFIIAWPAGLYLLISIGLKKRPLKEGLLFIGGAAFPALLVVGLSYSFNPNFIADYRAYGEPLGILEPADVKWLRLPGFYRKLFFRVGGTYHTTPLYLQTILFPLLLAADFFRNRNWLALSGFIGFNAALVIIGKYSQPSIIFILPFYYISAAGALKVEEEKKGARRQRRIPIYLSAGLLAATLTFSLIDMGDEREPFSSFIEKIGIHVPSDAGLVGNLYGEYITGEEGLFYDWRNLSHLRERGISLEDYLTDRSVEYIMLTDELDFIYRNRPVWNVLYGNLAHWYPSMLELMEKKGTLIEEFDSPGYGVRIAPYRYKREWKVRIYRFDQSDSISE